MYEEEAINPRNGMRFHRFKSGCL